MRDVVRFAGKKRSVKYPRTIGLSPPNAIYIRLCRLYRHFHIEFVLTWTSIFSRPSNCIGNNVGLAWNQREMLPLPRAHSNVCSAHKVMLFWTKNRKKCKKQPTMFRFVLLASKINIKLHVHSQMHWNIYCHELFGLAKTGIAAIEIIIKAWKKWAQGKVWAEVADFEECQTHLKVDVKTGNIASQ